MSQVFIFGVGFTGKVIAQQLLSEGVPVAGTTRSEESRLSLAENDISAHIFNGTDPMADGANALSGTTHLVISVQPDEDRDPVVRHHGDDIAALAEPGGPLKRIIYLSTTAVYGDQDGAWTDETVQPQPRSKRAKNRLVAETAWQDLADRINVPLDIFRLSGIYGPGRNQILGLKRGKSRCIVKPNHVFNRIHVEDIAAGVSLAISKDLAGAIYNFGDDEPAPPQEVVAYAAKITGQKVPPPEDYATAEMTPMARSFYAETKRLANDRLKSQLGLKLTYPTYREGLSALAIVEGMAVNMEDTK